jgi:hypothetical protein
MIRRLAPALRPPPARFLPSSANEADHASPGIAPGNQHPQPPSGAIAPSVVLSQTKNSGEATRRAAGTEKTGGLRSRSASAETRWAEPPPQANAQSESGRCLLRCLLRQGYEGQDAAVWRYRAVRGP